jgi:hypothetical protein
MHVLKYLTFEDNQLNSLYYDNAVKAFSLASDFHETMLISTASVINVCIINERIVDNECRGTKDKVRK